MDEPKRVVLEHYPVHKLPEDVREEFSSEPKVILTIESLPPKWEGPISFREFFETYAAKDYGTTAEEATERVRLLRDEWD